MRKFKESLADRILKGKGAGITNQHQSEIQKATRMVMTDDLVRKVVNMAPVTSPDQVFDLCFIAQLPDDVVWIEFNLHAKVGESRILGIASGRLPGEAIDQFIDIPNRCGALFTKNKTSPAIWMCDMFFYSEDKGFLNKSMVSYVLDTSGSDPEFKRIISPMQGPDHDKIVLGSFGFSAYGKAEHKLTDIAMAIPDPEYANALGLTNPQKAYRFFIDEVQENTGMLRFFVLTLALLNKGDPQKVYLPSPGRTLRNGKLRPLLDATQVTISVPNNKTIVQYVGGLVGLGNGRRLRLHGVRGHWRTVVPAKIECEHADMQHLSEHRHYCPTCEYQRTWVRSHERGDADLGTVKKEYRLTS